MVHDGGRHKPGRVPFRAPGAGAGQGDAGRSGGSRPHILTALPALLAVLLVLLGGLPAASQSVYSANRKPAGDVRIEYRLRIDDPNSHIYDVEIDIRGIAGDRVSLAMPAWAPGAYRIRDFARNVQRFEARSRGERRPLAQRKTDKQTWLVEKPPGGDILVSYQVYSDGLTWEMADVSPPATFMYVVDHKHVPVTLRVDAPRGWNVHIGLDHSRGAFQAPDYDVFIDAPAFIGRFKVLEFTSRGVPHRLVFSDPDVQFVEEQGVGDIRDIVEAAMEMFGSAPYPHYTFLFKVRPTPGSGGLEHLNSTRITVGENDFASGTRYDRFLFVVAHEFFHLWNVKRIRPEVLGPFDYTREVYTRLLWVSEGITSYYARLLLLRAGIFTPRVYLDYLQQEIDRFQSQPGRFVMSAEEASWNTWLRSDNSDNDTISYYTKGEIAGLLLDVEMRARTRNEKSLDDVMLYLKENYADRGIGFPEDGFLAAVNEVAGSDFGEFYQHVVQSRSELDYNRYMGQVGLRVQRELQPSALYMGVQVQEGDAGAARIVRVVPGSPAAAAGFDAGDILVAFDDRRITFANFEPELHRRRLGERFEVSVLRGQRLLRLDFEPGEIQPERWVIVEAPNVTPEQLELLRGWIGDPDW